MIFITWDISLNNVTVMWWRIDDHPSLSSFFFLNISSFTLSFFFFFFFLSRCESTIGFALYLYVIRMKRHVLFLWKIENMDFNFMWLVCGR